MLAAVEHVVAIDGADNVQTVADKMLTLAVVACVVV